MPEYTVMIDGEYVDTLVQCLSEENAIHLDMKLSLEQYLAQHLESWLAGEKARHFQSDIFAAAAVFVSLPSEKQDQIRALLIPTKEAETPASVTSDEVSVLKSEFSSTKGE